MIRDVESPFQLVRKASQTIELPLRHLILNHFSIIARGLLSPLIDSATNLTHLSLAWIDNTARNFFSSGSPEEWLKLAPRLRQLDLTATAR